MLDRSFDVLVPQPEKKPTASRFGLLFFLGVLCFLATQVFTRVPLLGWLQREPGFLVWAIPNALLSGVVIALSAGVFEETGRFAIRALLLKAAPTGISEPVIFGLGHGICEAVWIFLLSWSVMRTLDPSQFFLPIVERLLAITIHVGLSVMIWNGFQVNKRLRYLVLAILAHGLIDAAIPVAGSLGVSAFALEGLFAVAAVGLLIYVFYSRKYYRKEDTHEEKNLSIP